MAEWIVRKGTKERGFHYVSPRGQTIRDARVLKRIAALAVPPAWRDVHIAASPGASVQAWGFDVKGRKQYRYHDRAVERGTLRKYYRVRQMAHDLPAIRGELATGLRNAAAGRLTREAVTAVVVRLIADGFIRVGNERYARENRTFGAATMRKRHVRCDGDLVRFAYRGKKGIEQRQAIADRTLARVIVRLTETPGPRLFRYRADGSGWCDLTARDINAYLRQLGVPYTAKDFRTWGGTLRAATVLAELDPEGTASERERKKNVVTAMRLVSAELGNTPTICRASYVHPIVIARYLDEGDTIAPTLRRLRRVRDVPGAHAPEERALIAFLDRHFPERRRHQRTEAA